MISGTSIIVLNYTKYSDSSIIVHALSEHFGRISFLVYGIGGRHKNKLSAFQSLYLLDVELYYKAGRTLHKLKEHKINPPLFNLATDIRKGTLAIFFAELLSKAIKEEFTEKSLFDFIKTSILFLDELKDSLAIFHLAFLLKLSRYLGFAPESIDSKAPYYDYKEGMACHTKPHHIYYFTLADFQICINLLELPYNQLSEIKLTVAKRNQLLNDLLNLYEIHIFNFHSLNSYPVLKEVFAF